MSVSYTHLPDVQPLRSYSRRRSYGVSCRSQTYVSGYASVPSDRSCFPASEDVYKRQVIGITLGDAAGIGPEIVARVAAKGLLTQYSNPVIIADETIWQRGMKLGGVSVEYQKVDNRCV